MKHNNKKLLRATIILAMRKHHIFCRMLYISYRNQGCPVMIALHDFHDIYCVESKDGSFCNQQIKADCAWDAKQQGCAQWLEENNIFVVGGQESLVLPTSQRRKRCKIRKRL